MRKKLSNPERTSNISPSKTFTARVVRVASVEAKFIEREENDTTVFQKTVVSLISLKW